MSRESEELAKKALDGGVLIALAVDDLAASKLKEGILRDEALAFCSELAVVEMEYILCRRLGWSVAEEKTRHLLQSRVVNIVETGALMTEAAKVKCERALSLPDSFTLALARIFDCRAYFVKMEEEMEKEIKRRSFDVEVEFLI